MRKTVDIKEIKPNSHNPRLIKDDRFKKLVQSIKDLKKVPIDIAEEWTKEERVIRHSNR